LVLVHIEHLDTETVPEVGVDRVLEALATEIDGFPTFISILNRLKGDTQVTNEELRRSDRDMVGGALVDGLFRVHVLLFGTVSDVVPVGDGHVDVTLTIWWESGCGEESNIQSVA
jgi:hypothetical protein